MASLSELRRNREKSLANLNAQIANQEKKAKNEDPTFWKPKMDNQGRGFAVIHFMPAPGDEDLPYIQYWEHYFRGPSGKYYKELSLTTLGEPDPVGQLNTELWNSSDDENSPARKQARNQKRNLHYVANILVIQDEKNPENEGKVFRYRFGKKIFEKIQDCIQPSYGDPSDPFDPETGPNFILDIRGTRQADGRYMPNYDKAKFDGSASPIGRNDREIDRLMAESHPLAELIAPSRFKAYDVLKAKLKDVLGATSRVADEGDEDPAPSARHRVSRDEQEDRPAPRKTYRQDDAEEAPKPIRKAANPLPDDDEDAFAAFQKFADEQD